MATTTDILTAAALGEDSDWEFKSAKGGFPRSFWETYCAMANSDGGTVLLGVSEKGGIVRIDGLAPDQIANYKKILWDELNNKSQVNRNVLSTADVREAVVRSNGGSATLLAIIIPRVGRTDRPVHIGQNPFTGTYRRRHEGDYKCAEEEVRRMIADASPEPADHRILEGFAVSDLDAPSLAQYRQRMRAARGEHPWLSLADQELLEQLGGWRLDRTSGIAGLTLAGLLMFGNDHAIRDPAAAPSYFVDYRETLDSVLRWTDRVYPDGTWQANLFQFYTRVWPRLASALPTPFAIEGGVRKDDTEAHVALREAFVNALIHTDYSAAGGVVIEREPDRIKMENPGTLLVSQEQYQHGGVSECRNKAVQKMFLMIGGGEQAGSGAARIRTGWASRSWRAPWIETSTDPDRVRLNLPMVSLIPDTIIAHLRSRFAGRVDTFSADELQALATAALEGGVSNARLRALTTLHSSDITKLLQGLCDRGLLEADGYGRWTNYHLPQSVAQQPHGGGSTQTGHGNPPGSSGPLNTNSRPLGTDSRPLGQSSRPLGRVEPGRQPGETLWSPSSSGETLGLPAGEEQRLRVIAQPVSSKGKAAKPDVERVITELCTGRFLTGDLLSKLLDRSAEKLRKDYLSPMVEEGRLRYRHPESPNSPNQAYTSGGES